MRLSVVLYAVLVILLVRTGPLCADASRPPKTLEEVLKTVVLVRTGQQAGSGLLWGRPDRIVTALHVVAGGSHFSITYNTGSIPVTRDANFVCCIPEHDLALLELKSGEAAPNCPFVFQNAITTLKATDGVYAVGYPLALLKPDPTFLQVRQTSVPLRSILPKNERTELAKTLLDLDKKVLSLQGPLVPGLSGCPIVNKQFGLVGMGHGGLEGGHVDRCWAIPSSGIAALDPNTCSHVLPGSFQRGTLFGAAACNFFELQSIDPDAIQLDPGTGKDCTVGGSTQRDALFGVYVQKCGLLTFTLKNLNPRGVRGIVRVDGVLDTSGQKVAGQAAARPGRETTIGPIYVSAGRIYLLRVSPKDDTLSVNARIEAALESLPQNAMGGTYNTRQTALDLSQVHTAKETVGFGRNTEDWFRVVAPQSGAFTVTVENHALKGTHAWLAPVLIEYKGQGIRTGNILPGRETNLKRRLPVNAGDEILIRVRPAKPYHAAPYRLTWYLK